MPITSTDQRQGVGNILYSEVQRPGVQRIHVKARVSCYAISKALFILVHSNPPYYAFDSLTLYERAIGQKLTVPRRKSNRPECICYLASDIGAYDTCRHFCRYCYANNDLKLVAANAKRHDPTSPFLIENYEEGDRIHDVEEESWVDPQLSLF